MSEIVIADSLLLCVVQPKKRVNWHGRQMLNLQQLHAPSASRKHRIPQRNFFKWKYDMNTSATELIYSCHE